MAGGKGDPDRVGAAGLDLVAVGKDVGCDGGGGVAEGGGLLAGLEALDVWRVVWVGLGGKGLPGGRRGVGAKEASGEVMLDVDGARVARGAVVEDGCVWQAEPVGELVLLGVVFLFYYWLERNINLYVESVDVFIGVGAVRALGGSSLSHVGGDG